MLLVTWNPMRGESRGIEQQFIWNSAGSLGSNNA